jgi:hypothetical protein
MARFENGADGYAEGLAALVALVNADAGALAAHLADAVKAAAVRADRAIRPYPSFQIGICRLFVVEVLGV